MTKIASVKASRGVIMQVCHLNQSEIIMLMIFELAGIIR